ncbi:hypothetical protein BZG02_02125 [Labilibaculum filiforme]|uniref:STAS/SEC14 domain-containing protein n=1 Tax=Labilibaculum filiforme TaxID=1940526 RepID=A0A2N3I6E5_9BACT|nr:hypothetical protein [Labilibaculum filiforme]PKQ65823.1 hypothetical protein BZG02_02125 [Labilibaculum filiforme]
MIKTKFNHQTGILEAQYIGNITLKDILDYIDATKDNTTYPRNLRILTDASQANMLLGHNDIETIVNANNESLKNYNYIVDALIVDKPVETALSLFFKLLSENNKYKAKVFSTPEGAEYWLTNLDMKSFA